jgi:hypothetical protein
MENKIKSVEKGFGDNSVFFSTNPAVILQYKVDVIKEESKQISSDTMINIYRGYIGDKIAFEMGASIDVTVTYWTE